jgi:hypothetical protein
MRIVMGAHMVTQVLRMGSGRREPLSMREDRKDGRPRKATDML